MHAAVFERYGAPELVHVTEVPRPEPRAGEVLVRVRAAAVTSADARIRAARFPRGFGLLARLMFGLSRPRRPILGNAFSGVVEALGAKVTGLVPGDEVCGMTGMAMGAHAGYVALAASSWLTALYFLRDRAAVGPGMSVLVNGASGAIGTNAVQLAVHFGATVTGVTSGANAALVTRLGAANIIDYTSTQLASIGERFDVVFDTVGNLSIDAGRRLLHPNGQLLLAVAGLAETIRARGNVIAGTAPERVADIDWLLGLVADGRLAVVHDRSFDLSDIVQAHRLVDSGRKRGNVIVRP